MCTRYWTEESPELRPIVEEMNRSPLVRKWHQICAVKDYGEMRPTDVVPVIAPNRSGSRAVFPMKLGYRGKTLLMNARSETAAEKPTFKESLKIIKNRNVLISILAGIFILYWYICTLSFTPAFLVGEQVKPCLAQQHARHATGSIVHLPRYNAVSAS